jgi:hypothetical protein
MLGAFRGAVRNKTCNFGPLAQLVEQDPLKVKVLGSIPRRLNLILLCKIKLIPKLAKKISKEIFERLSKG